MKEDKRVTCVECGKPVPRVGAWTFKRWNGYYHAECIKAASESEEGLPKEPLMVCRHCDQEIEFPHNSFKYISPNTGKEYILHANCLRERQNLDAGYDRLGETPRPKARAWQEARVKL